VQSLLMMNAHFFAAVALHAYYCLRMCHNSTEMPSHCLLACQLADLLACLPADPVVDAAAGARSPAAGPSKCPCVRLLVCGPAGLPTVHGGHGAGAGQVSAVASTPFCGASGAAPASPTTKSILSCSEKCVMQDNVWRGTGSLTVRACTIGMGCCVSWLSSAYGPKGTILIRFVLC
jgi:hypothetical protein